MKFCLAKNIPGGSIRRNYTNQLQIGALDSLFFNTSGGSDAYKPDEYLNVWIADLGQGITGFASYPGQTALNKQGVVIQPDFFGINNSDDKYGLGRVLTHEMGHYFGLNHLWGEKGGCEEDDSIEDTPLQAGPYEDCPSYPQSSCGTSDMFMNFMDYVDDQCMIFFTHGQIDRMRETIALYRPRLDHSTSKCQPISVDESFTFDIFPTLASNFLTIKNLGTLPHLCRLELMDIQGKTLFRETVLIGDKWNIDTSKLSPGTYLLRVDSQTARFVIM